MAMLNGFAGEAIVQETFQQASNSLGFDLWSLIQEGPEEKLNATENTQPALLTASIALWRLWQDKTDQLPVVLAGHSLGEYSALVAAGVIEFTDAVSLVRQRGECMQAAVPTGVGAMAAILGLEDQKLVELCDSISTDEKNVSAANFNSPGQVVVAGHVAAVEDLIEKAKVEGAKRAVLLPVSVPSHCKLMAEAAAELTKVIDEITFGQAEIPVIQNVDAKSHNEPNDIKQALVEQLYKPVQWTRCIGTITEAGIDRIIECGPGKVLSGLIKRIDRTIPCQSIADPDLLEQAVNTE